MSVPVDQIQEWIEYAEQQLKFSRPDLREDLLQEGWVSALQCQHSFDPDAGSSMRSWVITHVMRDMVRYLRRNGEYVKIPDDIDILIEEIDCQELIDDDFESRHMNQEKVEHLAAIFSEREFNVLYQYYVEQRSEREIGEREGVSRSMIQKIRLRAIERLGGVN